jgi:hypothetical protein
MYGVLLSRFTTETLQENRRWKENNNVQCAYGYSVAISENLPLIDYFVIEMNNNTNKIEGIGLIQNKYKKGIKIYANPYFNRYIYTGKYFIAIDDIKNKEPLLKLEKILFYGKGHLKRGGLTLFPPKLLKNTEYLEWLKELLKEHLVTYNLSKEIPHC